MIFILMKSIQEPKTFPSPKKIPEINPRPITIATALNLDNLNFDSKVSAWSFK